MTNLAAPPPKPQLLVAAIDRALGAPVKPPRLSTGYVVGLVVAGVMALTLPFLYLLVPLGLALAGVGVLVLVGPDGPRLSTPAGCPTKLARRLRERLRAAGPAALTRLVRRAQRHGPTYTLGRLDRPVPRDQELLVAAGVAFVPGSAFAVHADQTRAARCCYASVDEATLAEAVARLASCVS